MRPDGFGEEFENIAVLHPTRRSRSEQPRCCYFSGLAPVAERNLAPLYCSANRALRDIVGGLDPGIPDKGEQSFRVIEEELCERIDLGVFTVEMTLGQRKELFLQVD